MSNELAVIETMDDLIATLSEYQPNTHNLVLPTTDLRFLQEGYRAIVNLVKLDPESDCYELDVTKNANTGWKAVVEKYGLAKNGLEKLFTISGASAEIADGPNFHDDGSVTMSVIARITLPDGITRAKTGTYTWRVSSRVEKARRAYEEAIAGDKPPKWFSGSQQKYKRWERQKFEDIRHRIITYATSYAETGATNRATRKILSLKDGYTPEEIARPFVCLLTVPPQRPALDLDNPVIQKLISHYMLETGKFPPIYEMERAHRLSESRARQPQLGGPDPMSDAVAAGEVKVPERKPRTDFGNGQPAIVEDIEVPPDDSESPDPRDWDDRPLEPEELRRRMNLEPGDNKPASPDLLKKYHAAMSTLTNRDDDARRRIQDYFYGAYSSKDMAAWQLGRLYLWIGTSKEVIDEATGLEEWVPCDAALKEAPAIIEAAHEKAARYGKEEETA